MDPFNIFRNPIHASHTIQKYSTTLLAMASVNFKKKIVGKPGHELGTVLPKHVAMLMWEGGGVVIPLENLIPIWYNADLRGF